MLTTNTSMKFLFCAPLGPIADPNRERIGIIRRLGFDVIGFDQTYYMKFGFVTRLQKKIGGFGWNFPKNIINAYNAEFLKRIMEIRPEIVWTEWSLLLLPETLAEARRIVPSAIFVSWVDDNIFGDRSDEIPIWRNFIASIPLYDLHFVKRKSDIQAYRLRGANRVAMIQLGYFSFHRPSHSKEIPDYYKHDTVFIGSAIDQRPSSIAYLMGKEHLPVDVYGNRWNRFFVYYRYRDRFHGYASRTDYAHIVSGSKIGLGYVSHSNHDEYTTRSTDIPACGGFLLAERTPTHLEMYEEGKEAEFFDSDAECADKIRFYLCHDEQRLKIAHAGYERCIRSDYSQERYTREAVQEIIKLRGEPNVV